MVRNGVSFQQSFKKKFISMIYILAGKAPFILGSSIALLLTLYLEYNYIFTPTSYQIFEIGGPLFAHPWYFLKNMYLSTWIIYRFLGIQGIGVPSYIVVYLLSSLGNVLGERFFLVIIMGIGFVSIYYTYKLFVRKDMYGNTTNLFALVFAYSYLFSPITSSMIFTTSYESYMLYSFEPLLLFFFVKSIRDQTHRGYSYLLVFTSLLVLLFYFEPGEVIGLNK